MGAGQNSCQALLLGRWALCPPEAEILQGKQMMSQSGTCTASMRGKGTMGNQQKRRGFLDQVGVAI